MHENTLYAFAWGCLAIVVLAIIAGATYYNITEPSIAELRIEATKIRMEATLQLVEEHGFNPMIFECMKRDWSTVGDFEICKIVAEDPYVTKEKLEERFDND